MASGVLVGSFAAPASKVGDRRALIRSQTLPDTSSILLYVVVGINQNKNSDPQGYSADPDSTSFGSIPTNPPPF